jgi:hypothetical protein
MRELTNILQMATAAVGADYFHLNVDGGDPVYRERVYCYELYHQMRYLWPEETPFLLNGEIDKAAHPILPGLGAAGAKPDFLVHQPGTMVGNYAIIEVKSSAAQQAGISADLSKLALFIQRVGYERALYIVYGREANEYVRDRIARAAKGNTGSSTHRGLVSSQCR